MTDSIRNVKVILPNIEDDDQERVRRLFKSHHAAVDDDGVVTLGGQKPKCILMPGSRGGEVKIKPKGASFFKPTELLVDAFHAPNYLTGHNLAHGCSVIASSQALVQALRLLLATQGCSEGLVNALSIDDISLGGVDITFLVEFDSRDEANAAMKVLSKASRGKGRKRHVQGDEETNFTVGFGYRDATVTSYNKTSLAHCKLSKSEDSSALVDFAARTCRVEVKLRERALDYLRGVYKLDFTNPQSWTDAHSNGLYEKIFNRYFAAGVCFGIASPRKNKPRAEKLDSFLLGFTTTRPFLSKVLAAYFAENQKEVVKLLATMEPAPRSLFLKRVREELQVNIEINWARWHELATSPYTARWSTFPGEHVPVPQAGIECFTKDSWPAMLERLKQSVEITLHNRAAVML